VIDVSWENAQSYVNWLSHKTGKPYRLPSESEWEYAARAGTTTRFSFGDALSPSHANFNGSDDGSGPSDVNRQKTMPVGSFRPSTFGLYDMRGNAWEWVEDCWHEDYGPVAPTDGSPWLEGNRAGRVGRGGSWEHSEGETSFGRSHRGIQRGIVLYRHHSRRERPLTGLGLPIVWLGSCCVAAKSSRCSGCAPADLRRHLLIAWSPTPVPSPPPNPSLSPSCRMVSKLAFFDRRAGS
jgi:hypothetical protein